MDGQELPSLTIKEAAHLAGVPKRRIEKDCEEGIVPRQKLKPWMHKGVAAHVPALAVVYACAMNSIGGVKLQKESKRRIWKHVHTTKPPNFGKIEITPGLTLNLDPLVAERWARTRDYLEARRNFFAVDPDIFGGEPILRGTRITCRSVLGRIQGGETLDDLVKDYPEISKEAFNAAVVYARTHPPRGRPSGKPWHETHKPR